jgi:hypothetical protein
MKYLKSAKNFYRDIAFTKEVLDSLSENELSDLRMDLIVKNREDYKQKTDELEIYQKIRFKDKELNKFNEWSRKSKITDMVYKKDGFYQDFYLDKTDNEHFTETEMKTYKLLDEVIKSLGGSEAYYKISLDSDIKKTGSKYKLYDL